eukprot:13284900-Ditylum_brightwellii.AAC.1
MEPTLYTPKGIDCTCPIPDDMMNMIKVHMPNVWEQARVILEEEEGLVLTKDEHDDTKFEVLPYKLSTATDGNNEEDDEFQQDENCMDRKKT